MKNSLIPKSEIVPGNKYWCIYNQNSVLHLMKYKGYETFIFDDMPIDLKKTRVMFEAAEHGVEENILTDMLIPKDCYWCNFMDHKELFLMRCENDNSMYSFSHDVFWPLGNVKVVFKDRKKKK